MQCSNCPADASKGYTVGLHGKRQSTTSFTTLAFRLCDRCYEDYMRKSGRLYNREPSDRRRHRRDVPGSKLY